MGTKSSKRSSSNASTTSSETANRLECAIARFKMERYSDSYRVRDASTGEEKRVPKILATTHSSILSRRAGSEFGLDPSSSSSHLAETVDGQSLCLVHPSRASPSCPDSEPGRRSSFLEGRETLASSLDTGKYHQSTHLIRNRS